MKTANLISLLGAYRNLSTDLLDSYLQNYDIQLKKEEFNDLDVLVKHLKSISKNIAIYDKFYIGYSIPQISKEFDLLRIDESTVVNVELKKRSSPEKIKAQLLRNKYYLSFLKKDIYIFSYTANDNKLYSIDYNQNLVEIHLRELITALVPQTPTKDIDIESYFKPSNYLISPFNSTNEFVKVAYFLTPRQEEIKTSILNIFYSSKYSIIAIKGKAGTGKTLLTYDIAREVMQSKGVLIVHCGILNQGHVKLRDDYGWDIIPIKLLSSIDLSKYYLVIIDEAQRIYKDQLIELIEKVKNISINCIFSYDEQQTLRKGEIESKISERIEEEITHIPFELTIKIRTNKEVASFIRCLFDKYKPLDKLSKPNIELNYFDDYNDAKSFLLQLKTEGWKIINYTPSTISRLEYERHKIEEVEDNAHTVIGQEYDNVVAVIDEHFYYKNGALSTKDYSNQPYYHPTKMLFQIVSRTRIKLNVVIIKNSEVLERCLSILNGSI